MINICLDQKIIASNILDKKNTTLFRIRAWKSFSVFKTRRSLLELIIEIRVIHKHVKNQPAWIEQSKEIEALDSVSWPEVVNVGLYAVDLCGIGI